MSSDRESDPLVTPAAASAEQAPGGSESMLPQRDRRSWPERLLVRVIATCGIIGIGVAIAAIMHSSGSEGWLIGLVVSIVSVMLAALLWSSRVL